MSDMADFLLESADWDGDGLEWEEYEDIPYVFGCTSDIPRGPQPKRCRYCGEAPLYWCEMWPHHWRLKRSDGTLHACNRNTSVNNLLQDIQRRFK